MARLSRRLWGGTSLKMAAKEARLDTTVFIPPVSMSGHFRNVFMSSSDISVLLVVFLLYMLRLVNFFMILSYDGCFGLRTLLKDKEKISKFWFI